MESVRDVTGLMRDHLAKPEVGERLRRIARFGNSFEGWLKWELVHALQQHLPNEVGVPEHIGVEWRYRRAQQTIADRTALECKLIDLWVGKESTAYIELKVAFANQNQGKQWGSWMADFTRLQLVLADEPAVAGYASVLVAVDFKEEPWRRACEALVTADPAVHFESAPLTPGDPSLRFACLVREVASIR